MTTATFLDALGQLSQRELALIKHSRAGAVPLAIPPHVLLEIPEGMEDAPYEMTAWLYARYPVVPGDRGNMGALMRALNDRLPNHDTEKRFMEMLNRDLDGLRKPLEWTLATAQQEKLSVDWLQLLDDLIRWEEPNHSVQRVWARSFWGQTLPDDDPELTMAEAVAEFGLNASYQQQLSRVAAVEQFSARRVGRAWVARRSAIQEWLENRTGPGRPAKRNRAPAHSTITIKNSSKTGG